MDKQLNLPLLGKLRILEVYEFYDIPRLFLCCNASGQHFIALSITEDQDSHTYLFASTSVERLKAIIRHEYDLRKVFLHAEDEFVYVSILFDSGDTRVETIPCSQISQQWLPEKDEYISPQIKIKEYLVHAVNQ